MSSVSRTGFGSRLRGFLGSTKLTGSVSAGHLTKATKSLSTDPVEPVDALFSVVTENYKNEGHDNVHAITQQLLANDVLNSLIRIQSDLSNIDETPSDTHETPGMRATYAYNRAQRNYAPAYLSDPIYRRLRAQKVSAR